MKAALVILLLILLYLNRAYDHFYNFIGNLNLQPPIFSSDMVLGQSGKVLKYVALGDSLTSGVGAKDYKNSYPYLLAQKLSSQNRVELINLSHKGDKSADLLASQLPLAIKEHPEVVSVFIGINDLHNLVSLKEYQNNLGQIISQLQQHTKAKVYLISLPYLGSEKVLYPPYTFLLNFRTNQFNNVIKNLSTKKTSNWLIYPKPKFYTQRMNFIPLMMVI